jgi:predicted ArsR family transcriptional regulator
VRAWKKAESRGERVFLYFRGHPAKLFTIEHVASQVKIGRRQTRLIVKHLVEFGKLEGIETVSSKKWGRPRVMYRSIRAAADSIKQLEIFDKFLKDHPHERII